MSLQAFPRQFVKHDDALSSWEEIEPYLDTLENRTLDTPERLNEWLLHWSELAACIDEVGTDRYVRMTCQTDDEQRKKAFLDFVENIEPKCKPRWHAIEKKFAAAEHRSALPSPRFDVFNRSVENQVALYRDENVPLQVAEAKLEQQYQEIVGAMTVTYEGQEQTLQQLSRYLERPDRDVREEVWRLAAERRQRDADRLEDLFEQLIQLRHRMAVNAGCDDYREYAFKKRERFDYTPHDCIAFHDAIEKTCVPVLRSMQQKRKRILGVASLRPWDMSVDVRSRPPLKPFETSHELIDRCARIFDCVDVELGEQFREMARSGCFDLDSRKGKAPGGYQSTYHETRRPFIFMNAVGMQRDVRTLLHEGGHAFHALACRDEPIVHYRSAPIEFAEVASMAMELLAYDHLDVFYSGEDLDRARRSQIEGVVKLFPWVATIDAFQHWIYTHPDHTREQRRNTWRRLHERFGGIEDYAGFEHVLDRRWQQQLHLYEVPFYYVEYGIAQLGALQVWQNAKRNRPAALAAYRRALSLGGSRPLPGLFEAAAIKFDFTIDTLGPLMDAIHEELMRLAD